MVIVGLGCGRLFWPCAETRLHFGFPNLADDAKKKRVVACLQMQGGPTEHPSPFSWLPPCLGQMVSINVVCQSLYVSSLVRVLQRRHLSQLLRRVEVSLPQASLALSSFWVLVELLPSRSDDSNGNDATNTFRWG